MKWNGYDNLWSFYGVKSAWNERSGTSGEINLILINRLREAGLNANPILVSTREHGQVRPSDPSTGQFNKVLAYVTIDEKDERKNYFLDATDTLTPSHLIPEEVMFSNGLLITKSSPVEYRFEWKPIWTALRGYRNSVIVDGRLDEIGWNGKAAVHSYDYSRIGRLADYKKKKQEEYFTTYLTAANPSIQINDFKLENERNDSLPLVQNFEFSEPLASSGGYRYFSLNRFCGLDKNPFVADNRFSDVFFGTVRDFSINANITIPEGYVFEGIPKNTKMILPDTSISFTRASTVFGSQLSVRISLEFKRAYYTREEYHSFREFYKRLFDALNEQYVVRKNDGK